MNKATETIAENNYYANSGISLGSISGCTLYIKEDLKIKDVIFNPPATIVFWTDGTKTVVKSHKDDVYSQTWGLMFCFAKKLLGSGHQVRKMLDKYAPGWGDEISIDQILDRDTKKVSEQPIIVKELPKNYTAGAEKVIERYLAMQPQKGVVTPKCNLQGDMDDANYMIFNDKETTKRLEEILKEYSYLNLLETYHELNNWKLPRLLAQAINFPTYLYSMFNTFDIPVKEKTITPLIKFVSCEIAKREYRVFSEEHPVNPEEEIVEYTWEKRHHIEH